MTSKQRLKASKFLALILRHDPAVGNITLDAQGWASTKSVMSALRERFPITPSMLTLIVAEDTKQRYSFSAHGECIRANQGHSIAVDLGLVPVMPPEFLFHGTAKKSLWMIRRDGLLPMDREFVHISEDQETALTVGKRHGDPTVIVIKAADMVTLGGLEFYKSENNVWLAKSVPVEYLEFEPNE